MSLSPATIDAMVAAGLTVEQLATVVKAELVAQAEQREQEAIAAAAAEEARREANRAGNAERQRRFKAKRRGTKDGGNGDNALPTVTAVTSPEVSPNDIYSNPLPTPSGAKAPSLPLAEQVVKAWNEGPGAAGAVTAKPLNADRRKALSVRVRENGEPAVFAAIRNLGRSAWHCGGNDRGWRADIGWLLKSPEHFQKALEMEPARAPTPTTSNLASLSEQASRYRYQRRHAA